MEVLEYIRLQIEILLKKNKISKTKLVELLGMKIGNYYALFARKSLKLETYLKICEILKVDPASLFPGHDPKHKMYSENNEKYTKLLEDQNTLLKEKIANYEKNK